MKEIILNLIAGWRLLLVCAGYFFCWLTIVYGSKHILVIMASTLVIIAGIVMLGVILGAAYESGKNRRAECSSRILKKEEKANERT